ncbi:MAG: amidohydrolase family protein, partial [Victivallales bacterium]|nr:amidohydrolase family protein [Victivallales bacterium]
MSSLLIKNAHVISPDVEKFNAAVFAEDGVIKQVIDAGNPLPKADKVVDIKGKMLVPGFIDLHIHGGMGYESTSPKKEAVKVIAEAKIKEGVTSFCPTTLTLPEDKLAASLKNIEAYRKKPTGAKVIGTHLEGPYINPDCIGAQNPAYLRKPDFDEVKRLNAISKVSIITYAIEVEGAVPFTAKVIKAGIVPSCGHTNATMAQYKAGQAKGLCRRTHFC